MFNLKQSREQLVSANQGMADLVHVRYSPSRDVTGNNFPNGPQYIRWSVGGNKWWIPSKSFLRLRYTIKCGDGTPVLLSKRFGMNMGTMGNLYQSMEFRINNNSVCRISDYVPQVDMLCKRLTKSGSWLNSTGAATNNYEGSFLSRQHKICADGMGDVGKTYFHAPIDGNANVNIGQNCEFMNVGGNNTIQFYANNNVTVRAGTAVAVDMTTHFGIGDWVAINDGAEKVRQVLAFYSVASPNDTLRLGGAAITAVGAANLVAQLRTISNWPKTSSRLSGGEIAWQPPLGIFRIGHALPAGNYELVLNPQNSNVFQKLAIESMYKDIPQAVAATDVQFSVTDMYLEVAEVKGPRVDNITYLLDLPVIHCQKRTAQATTGLTQEEFTVNAATQALTVAYQDSRTGSATQNSAAFFRIGLKPGYDELHLNRMFINYAGVNKPQPDADPEYKPIAASQVDWTTQRYMETILNSGSYFKADSETIEEWHERGAYYYFSWPRDDTSRDTRVFVNSQFREEVDHASILLFNHYRKTVMIKITNGLVTDVLSTSM